MTNRRAVVITEQEARICDVLSAIVALAIAKSMVEGGLWFRDHGNCLGIFQDYGSQGTSFSETVGACVLCWWRDCLGIFQDYRLTAQVISKTIGAKGLPFPRLWERVCFAGRGSPLLVGTRFFFLTTELSSYRACHRRDSFIRLWELVAMPGLRP